MSPITLKRNLLFAAVLVGAATTAWFLTGCRDDRSNVMSPAVRSNLLSPPQASQLFVCAADTIAASDTATIGPLGAVIHFGPHSLVIPPGALLRQTTITATMPADGHLTAVLQPEGLQFLVPATLSLGYGQCDPQPDNTLSIVYLNGPLGQILQWLPSLLHLDSHTVTALIGHFSVYAGAERR
ncbi:MAG TPA: hypothetical protein VFA43_20570 [Gemmatimonadaceae bacterium]|nr:hypothetical protein [Gemmatimonadaceae bacterium]